MLSALTLSLARLAAVSTFAKSYLNVLVDEIVVNKDQATMKGRHLALVDAAQRSSSISGEEVPSFILGLNRSLHHLKQGFVLSCE